MNDLNFFELTVLLQQLTDVKSRHARFPETANTGICLKVKILRPSHVLDWPKHSGDPEFPISLDYWIASAEKQYFEVFRGIAPSHLQKEYVTLREELLDFLIDKTKKELSERQEPILPALPINMERLEVAAKLFIDNFSHSEKPHEKGNSNE